jgi:hypothetical protein
VVEHLVEYLGGLEPAAKLGRDCGNGGLEDLAEAIVNDRGKGRFKAFVSRASARGTV